MKIEVVKKQITEVMCKTIILHIFEGNGIPGGSFSLIDEQLAGTLSRILQDQPDSRKYGATTVVYTLDALPAKQLILLGCGKQDELTLDKLRALTAIALQAAEKIKSTTIAWHVDNINFDAAAAVAAIVEGAELGVYRFDQYKTVDSAPQTLQKLILVEPAYNDRYRKAITQAQITAAGVNLARDLVNHPAGFMTPTQMAEQAEAVAHHSNLELMALDRETMEQLQMNALLAVAKGSDEPPKMLVLKYTGNPTDSHFTAFIGKGITFDSGGISLKPSEGMQAMKDDMAGGATVLGAMLAIGQLKPKANIWGIIPCTENMPSGHACRPGDVITAMSGKTIEVVSTDAEGRLILADAITYAVRRGATRIIDLATLTGACVVALGTLTSGVMSNNQSWCQKVLMSADQVGEKMWQLPSYPEYKELIKSDIADIKNSGGRPAGAITAGMFLAEFAEQTPWVHIDIAGTVSSDKDRGYNVKGATGVGVRTLVHLAQTLSLV